MVTQEIEGKNMGIKPNLPVSGFALRPYVGCTHACKYRVAAFLRRCFIITEEQAEWN